LFQVAILKSPKKNITAQKKIKKAEKYSRNSESEMFKESLKESKTEAGVRLREALNQ
jgi:hypothetical protein